MATKKNKPVAADPAPAGGTVDVADLTDLTIDAAGVEPDAGDPGDETGPAADAADPADPALESGATMEEATKLVAERRFEEMTDAQLAEQVEAHGKIEPAYQAATKEWADAIQARDAKVRAIDAEVARLRQARDDLFPARQAGLETLRLLGGEQDRRDAAAARAARRAAEDPGLEADMRAAARDVRA